MKFKKSITSFCIILCLIVIPRICMAVSLSPADMTGLRSFNNGATVLLLTFDAVKSGTEDRTIAHFDISGLSGVVPLTMLNIPIRNIDPGLPEGTFEVYSFAGDGVVSTDEWNSGTLFHTFTGISQPNQLVTFKSVYIMAN